MNSFEKCFFICLICIVSFVHKGDSLNNLKLVIDNDGGADDAMAIFMALLYQSCFNGPRVVAMTTVFGNVNEDQAYLNAQKILNVAGYPEIPIYRGANKPIIKGIPSDGFFGEDGLGGTTLGLPVTKKNKNLESAVAALLDLSWRYKDKLIVVALGAATNIALAIRSDPDFINRLAHLYVGGTNIANGELYNDPEFNVAVDPEAYQVIAETYSPNKITILPFSQVQTYVKISKEWHEEVFSKINTNIVRALNDFETIAVINERNLTGWNRLDPVVMASFLNSNIVNRTKLANVNIDLCGDERGRENFNFDGKNANTNIIVELKKEDYEKFIVDVFSKDPASCMKRIEVRSFNRNIFPKN